MHGKNKQGGGGKTLPDAQILYTAVTSSPLSADVTDPTFLTPLARDVAAAPQTLRLGGAQANFGGPS